MRASLFACAGWVLAVGACGEATTLKPAPTGLAVAPEAVDFGAVPLGGAGEETVTLTNLGAFAITLELTKPDAPFEARSPTSVRLEAFERREAVVRFRPFSGGASQGALVVRQETGEATSISLRGEGVEVAPAAVLCATPFELDFGDVAVGASRTLEVMLASCGAESVRIARVGRAAGSDAGFQVSAAPIEAPAAGAPPATLAVTFAPDQTSAARGTVRVEPVDGPALEVEVRGRGVAPCALSVAPTELDFAGSVADKRFLIQNAGPACTLAGIRVVPPEAPFSIVGTWSGVVLETGTATVVRVDLVGAPDSASALAVVTSEAGDEHPIPLNRVAAPTGCALDVEPGFVSLGVVALGTTAAGTVRVTNVGGAECKLEAFLVGSSTAALAFALDGSDRLAPAAAATYEVRYAPRREADLDARLSIRSAGAQTREVPIIGRARQGALCVEPELVDFGVGDGPVRRTIALFACAGRDVRVDSLEWKWGHPAFRVTSAPSTPIALTAGDRVSVEVEYVATDELMAEDDLVVRSDAALRPRIDVRVRARPIVPPEAGHVLYGWQRSDAGTIVRAALPDGPVEQILGRRVDGICAGCHVPSPDGRFLLLSSVLGFDVFEVATGTYVRRIRNNAIYQASWNPDVNTTPPYQFVFAQESGGLHITSALGGPITAIPGASDPSFPQLMPSWSSDGRIAFVRAPGYGVADFLGPSDVMTIPATGGVATPLPGASNRGLSIYYPTFSPDAQWIAFTECHNNGARRGCADGRIRVVRADGSGQRLELDAVNAGHRSSMPSWNLTGRLLAFASERPGGLGGLDVYVVAFDPRTGLTGRPRPVPGMNTPGEEYWVWWSR